jgi:hypothetical protein
MRRSDWISCRCADYLWVLSMELSRQRRSFMCVLFFSGKYVYPCRKLHGVMSQKSMFAVLTALSTSDLLTLHLACNMQSYTVERLSGTVGHRANKSQLCRPINKLKS